MTEVMISLKAVGQLVATGFACVCGIMILAYAYTLYEHRH